MLAVATEFFRIRLPGYECVYCGEVADTRDHFPPRSYGPRGFLLPACRQCNDFAGTEFSLDFQARVHHVKRKLLSRYKRWINTPDWSEEELLELGQNLKLKAKKWQIDKAVAQRRIAWNAMSYLRAIASTRDFVLTYVEQSTTTESEELLLMPTELLEI
jgi:hypothetical protein